jgi:N-acetylmuramoyl-L-alanine amidase CwlA
MFPITKDLISNNYSKGVVIKPLFIIIHETGNPGKGADAMSNRNYFQNNPQAQASAHFCVDDHSIVQCLETNQRGWHIGVIYGHPVNNPLATNSNSVGVEICTNSDGNFAKARANAIDLTKYLMTALSIPASNVIRHYDACLKHCPSTMLDNPQMWLDFKDGLRQTAAISQPAAAHVTMYTVAPGDTLGGIASKFNTTAAVLAELNGLYDPNVLNNGQVLRIAKRIYRVQPKDTLASIAAITKTSVNTLATINNIKDINSLKVGQLLIIE